MHILYVLYIVAQLTKDCMHKSLLLVPVFDILRRSVGAPTKRQKRQLSAKVADLYSMHKGIVVGWVGGGGGKGSLLPSILTRGFFVNSFS